MAGKNGSEMIQHYPKGFLVRSYLAHNIIFSEGSQGDSAFILIEGQVEISSSVGGRKKILAQLRPVSIFGEMALFLEDRTRTATALATTDCRLVVVTRDALDDYLVSAPPMITSIMTVLVHRLKATTRKARLAPNVPLGICRVLNLFALNGHSELKYDSAVRTLAETFLQPPETIERHLNALAAQGLVSIRRRDADPAVRMLHLETQDLLEAVLTRAREPQI